MDGRGTLCVSQSVSLRLLTHGGVRNPECESEATDAWRSQGP